MKKVRSLSFVMVMVFVLNTIVVPKLSAKNSASEPISLEMVQKSLMLEKVQTSATQSFEMIV